MLKNYLKLAFKVLLRRKFFTLINLFAISLTLMVLMVATAVLDQIFGPLPPEANRHRTLGVYYAKMSGPQSVSSGFPGYRFLDRYVRNLPQAEKVSICSIFETTTVYRQGEPIKLWLKYTDGAFWEILGFDFLEGGPFTADDDRNGHLVAVINEATRGKFFDGQPAVGRNLEIDGRQFRVIGVVANAPFLRLLPFADIWIPHGSTRVRSNEMIGNYLGMILARDAQDIPTIKAEFQARLSQVEFDDPKQFNHFESAPETFFEYSSRLLSQDSPGSRPGLLLAGLIGGAILFMLLPAINLININLSRIMERSSEIGVRKAFGASSWTVLSQFVIENVMLTLLGGAIGLALSRIVLFEITASGLIPWADFQLNYRIFGYGLLMAVCFGLLSGVYPAWKMSRLHPVDALKGGGR
ncbi:MAG TPA: ABC transporter permease [Blastocatellia bacterium]|nr:ABC transporter permease [Blastocatellia bacterium]